MHCNSPHGFTSTFNWLLPSSASDNRSQKVAVAFGDMSAPDPARLLLPSAEAQ